MPPLKENHTVVVISIIDPECDPVNLPVPETDVLRLGFHDLDNTYPCTQIVLFDTNMALKIKLFIEQKIHQHGPDDLIVVVHCEAGISRSAGVAGALAKHFLGTDKEFFTYPFLPNRLAYRLLLNALTGMDNPIPNVILSGTSIH